MTEETDQDENNSGHPKSYKSPNEIITNNNNNFSKSEVRVSTLIYDGFKDDLNTFQTNDETDEEVAAEHSEIYLARRHQSLPSSSTEEDEEVTNSNANANNDNNASCPVSITVTGIVENHFGSSSSITNSSNESLIITSGGESTTAADTIAVVASSSSNASGAGAGNDNRRHSKSSSLPHGVKLCSESSSSSSTATATDDASGRSMKSSSNNDVTDNSPTEEKWVKLELELKKALEEIKAKDVEVEKLKDIKQQVEGEIEDLTASLFVEAHKMVSEAKMKEISSEKCLKEAQMQMDGLQAEVAALKALLITSTPSRPNLGPNGSASNNNNGISIFKKQHKRFPSHNQLQYGRTEAETEKEKSRAEEIKPIETDPSLIDPAFHRLFVEWKKEPSLTAKDKSPFLQTVYNEDIDPCMSFDNTALVGRLRKAIEENSIWVEPVAEKDKNNIPKECALLRAPRICHYRLSFDYQSDEWFEISQLCRDRIASVCEFLNYLRYIRNGLVKSSVDVAYWEIIRLRRQMALAKLGIPFQ